jgi:hypothetical protein
MAEVAKRLTHLTVDQAFVGSIPIFRPIFFENAPLIWTKVGTMKREFLS